MLTEEIIPVVFGRMADVNRTLQYFFTKVYGIGNKPLYYKRLIPGPSLLLYEFLPVALSIIPHMNKSLCSCSNADLYFWLYFYSSQIKPVLYIRLCFVPLRMCI